MNEEFSELQAVDFAFGAFIAGAYQGLNKSVGPKGYREFLSRSIDRQIFRHDADSPMDFLKAMQSDTGNQREVAGKSTNSFPLPLIYYYRKPGFTNGVEGQATRQALRFAEGKIVDGVQSEPSNLYRLLVLPVVLEYKINILAWDKPTLDKISLVWYAYTRRNDKFECSYQIGEDPFDAPAHIQDNKSVLLADSSIPPSNGNSRVYAVQATVQVETDIICGSGVAFKDPITIIFCKDVMY
jgi:hypothetical protein